MKSDNSGLVKLYKWSIFDKFSSKLTAAVSCRDGGVSKNQYKSLNLGLHTNDNPLDIIENRNRVCKTLKVEFSSYTTAKQIHSSNIKLIQGNHRLFAANLLTAGNQIKLKPRLPEKTAML